MADKMNQDSYNWGWSENLQEGSSPATGMFYTLFYDRLFNRLHLSVQALIEEII